jgi:DNA-binding response OmpR family regulator
MGKVLLVEDDINIAKALKFNLEQSSLDCLWAQNLAEANQEIARSELDLILMDIGLPDGSGLDMCRDLRGRGMTVPIILLTARLDEESLIAGFEGGATDYIRKPFSNRELLARVNANLGRNSVGKSSLTYKGLTVEPEGKLCTFNGEKFRLNRKQFDILYYLMSNVDRVVSRDSLLRYLGRHEEVFDRTIDAHISQLRKKLRDKKVEGISITSIYGLGYTIGK